jgi:O-antigen/teichoic acid export membrane protein
VVQGQWLTRRLNRILEYLDSKSPAFLHKYWRSLDPSSIKRRFLKGAFWNSAGAVSAQIFRMASAIFLARLLGKEGYGEYGMVISTLGMFGAFASLQQSASASVFVAQYRETDKPRTGKIIRLTFYITLVMAAGTGLIIFFISPSMSQGVLKNQHLTSSLRFAACLIFLTALNGALSGILTGFEAFKRLAYLSVITNFLSLPFIVVGALWLGLPGVFLGNILVQAVLTFVYYEDIRHRARANGIHINEHGYLSELKMVLLFSIPTMGASMISGPATWASNAFLVNQPGGYGELGIFQAAQQWRSAVLMLPSLINSSALPLLANAVSNRKSFVKTAWYNILSCGGLAIAAGLVFILFSKFIMSIYGKEFRGGTLVLALTVLMAVLQAVSQALTQVMISTNRVWTHFAVNAGLAGALVLFSYLWVPKGLAAGLALANAAAWGVMVLWQTFFVVKIMRDKKIITG